MTTFVEFVADSAVECGLTIAQALDHSPAQLKLIRTAARRLRANKVFGIMNATYAAMAAVMLPKGHSVFSDLKKQLASEAES